MICPSCKTKNQYYHRYCYYCGYKLDTTKPALKAIKTKQNMEHIQHEIENSPEHAEYPQYDEEIAILSQTDNDDEDTYESDIEDIEDEKIGEVEEANSRQFESISESQQSLYEYLFEEKGNDFDITREIPLRRYRKNRSSRNRSRLASICVSIILIALSICLVFFLVKQVGNIPKQVGNPRSITVSSTVNPVEIDGKPAHQIVFSTTNGKEVKILDRIIQVEDGQAEIILEDSYLYTLNPIEKEDGLLELQLDYIISAPGFEDTHETVSITLEQPYAPLTLIQPSSSEAVVDGNSFQLVISVEPGSKVFINDNDYTDLVDEGGRLVKDIDVPIEDFETYVTVKVTKQGYVDNTQEIVLRRPAMEVPITINERSPIPSQGQWVKVSGSTLPGASISVDGETREDSIIDLENGKFVLYIKASYPGYTPCLLTAELDGKVSSKEIILDGETNVDKYTSTAWKPEYEKMLRDPKLHNGRHFLFRGTVQDILMTGYKNIFTVNISNNADSEQLIHVEYWGNDFNYNKGDKIRIFGNRWGNIDNMLRILAKYIYNR